MSSLATKLQELSITFRKSQSAYLKSKYVHRSSIIVESYFILCNITFGDGLATLLEEMTTGGQSGWQNGNQEKENGGEVDKKEEGEMITVYVGTTWARLAKDMKTWRDHEEGYIQHWIDTA